MMMRLLVLLAASLAILSPAEAQSQGPMPSNELKTVERALARTKAREQALTKAAEAVAREEEAVSRQLVDTAAQIQARQAIIAACHDRIGKLASEQTLLRNKLGARRSDLSTLLAGLVKLERNPPPALLAAPGDGLQALRAAMLFSA